MKYLSMGLLACALFLAFSGTGLAHKMDVTAFVDGDEIRVEGDFDGGHNAGNVKVTANDSETGDVIAEGTTDEHGIFRFKPSADFLRSGHGINIHLLAEDGHRADWTMSSDEVRALAESDVHRTSRAGRRHPDELEAFLERILDEKLAPINQALARQQKQSPELKDIVGGIGWIVGLLGMAAYVQYRRRAP